MYFYELKKLHPEHKPFLLGKKRNNYFQYYFYLKEAILGKEIYEFVVNEGVTIRYLLEKKVYKKYLEQRERILKKCIDIFGIRDDIFNLETYKTQNLMKSITYYKITFYTDYSRED